MTEQMRTDRTDMPEKELHYSSSTVAALVEEMVAKGYDMAKARMAKLVEVICPDRRNEWNNGLNRETADLIGILLDDMAQAQIAIAKRLAPEITAEMIAKAERARRQDAAQAKVDNLHERVRQLEEELRDARQELERTSSKASPLGMPKLKTE